MNTDTANIAANKQRMMMEILGAKPIAFNPQLARLCGSVKAGLFLSQLLYWMNKTDREWIYKTIKDFEEETALTRREQDSAITRLTQLGFIEVDLKGMPARRHFRVDCTKVTTQFVQKLQTSLHESAKLHTYTDSTTDIQSYRLPVVAKSKTGCPLLKDTPLKKKYPHGHTECEEYIESEEQDRGAKFVNRAKQYGVIHRILRAGFDFSDMDKTIRLVEKKYGKGAWDYGTLASWLEKGSSNA